jgi:hypothetical protein
VQSVQMVFHPGPYPTQVRTFYCLVTAHHLHHLQHSRKPRQMGTSCAVGPLANHLRTICDHLHFCCFGPAVAFNKPTVTHPTAVDLKRTAVELTD